MDLFRSVRESMFPNRQQDANAAGSQPQDPDVPHVDAMAVAGSASPKRSKPCETIDLSTPDKDATAHLDRFSSAEKDLMEDSAPKRRRVVGKSSPHKGVGSPGGSGSSSSSSARSSSGSCGGIASDAGGAMDASLAHQGDQRTSETTTVDGWVVVSERVLNPNAGELKWLMENLKSGELCSSVYTGRKVLIPGTFIWGHERVKPTSLSFGAMPELEPDWSDFQQRNWLHMPGAMPSEQNFNFQRVRVQFADPPSCANPAVRITMEWSPRLAFQHMATRIGFHAAHATLRCKVAAMQPPGWKPSFAESEDEKEEEFFLSGCAGEMQASQPPRFCRFKLRSEQLRSLRWMLDREARPARFESEVTSRVVPGVEWDSQPEQYSDTQSRRFADYWSAYQGCSGFSWCYEPTVQAAFSISGGVLGDAIGTGKTATLIGLLDSQRCQRLRNPTSSEASHLIPTNATLILVPSNLLGQWEGEFKKFLGPDAFKFLVIRTILDLKNSTIEDLRQCEVVLTTYKLLYSNDYVGRLKCLQCTRANHLHERSFLGRPIEKTLAEVERAQAAVMASSSSTVGWTLRMKNHHEQKADRDEETDHTNLLTDEQVESRIATLGLCTDWKKMPHPVFELFFWQRIVFDEFHELEAMDKRRRCMLQNLRSKYRWGLTGTPPKRDMDQITTLAGMLRVRLAEDDPVQCQHFLDIFVRQNFSELPEIPVREHIISIEPTIEERAIYLQHAYDGNTRSLLQLCSHHCLKGQGEEEDETVVSAKLSVSQLQQQKRTKQVAQKKIVEKEYQILAALGSGCPEGHRPSTAEADAKKKLDELEAQVRAVGDDALNIDFRNPSVQPSLVDTALANVDHSRPGSGKCAEVLRCIRGSGKPALTSLRTVLIAQLGRCHAVLAKLLSMTRSLRFFEATLGVLRGADGDGEAQECPICMESMTPETTALLPCAHAFHWGCLEQAGAVNLHCPTCRSPFEPGQAVLVSRTEKKGISKHDDKEVEQFGSKLVSIAKTLRGIRKKDPKAKAIVFVQWRELEGLVGDTLQEMGIEHVRLKGTTIQRSRLIREFQEEKMPWVLLQSLENSASGANLTRASHVLLVHPMDASSTERAVSYEMQALGRVRRCGQEAKEVHLYRFVTKGTIEEEISQLHQVGVSSRLQAGQSTAASSSSGH